MGFTLRTIRRGRYRKLLRSGVLLAAGAAIGTAGIAVGSAYQQQQTAQRLRYRNGVVPACVDMLSGAVRLVLPTPTGQAR